MTKLKRPYPRVQTKLSGVSKTDQSYKKSSCINNIVKTFAKTGHLPAGKRDLSFADVSEVPSLMEMHEISLRASQLFMELPADIRRLMDNDPTQLEQFIADPKNKQICIDNGLLEKEIVKHVPENHGKLEKEAENHGGTDENQGS
jgi:hypothetical protein